jgi:hypothetical protein
MREKDREQAGTNRTLHFSAEVQLNNDSRQSGERSIGKKIPRRMPKRMVLSLVLIVVVSVAVYSNALLNDFVFDDIQLITNNDTIKDFRYIPEIFTENLWGVLGRASNYYRPLAPLIYMMVYHIFGSKPWAFHLVNILFHSGVSLLVYFILSRVVKKDDPEKVQSINFPAFIPALLFAVHPIHTEAVTWIAGIMDLSCTFFALLSFHSIPGRSVLKKNLGFISEFLFPCGSL